MRVGLSSWKRQIIVLLLCASLALPLTSPFALPKASFDVVPISQKDLPLAASICVEAFFGDSNGNMIRDMYLTRLENELLSDLSGKIDKPGSSLLKISSRKDYLTSGSVPESPTAITENTNEMCGFVELTVLPEFRFLGEGFAPASDAGRPVLANLAVAEPWRRQGLGAALVAACEDDARRRGFLEVVLQVEEDNGAARSFYQKQGYAAVFCDRAARRYDLNDFVLRNVRSSRITMRKALASQRNVEDPWAGFLRAISSFMDIFSV
jgi:ribosomal protein S18 acetylase RimI-like enzyme